MRRVKYLLYKMCRDLESLKIVGSEGSNASVGDNLVLRSCAMLRKLAGKAPSACWWHKLDFDRSINRVTKELFLYRGKQFPVDFLFKHDDDEIRTESGTSLSFMRVSTWWLWLCTYLLITDYRVNIIKSFFVSRIIYRKQTLMLYISNRTYRAATLKKLS